MKTAIIIVIISVALFATLIGLSSITINKDKTKSKLGNDKNE